METSLGENAGVYLYEDILADETGAMVAYMTPFLPCNVFYSWHTGADMIAAWMGAADLDTPVTAATKVTSYLGIGKLFRPQVFSLLGKYTVT